MMQLVCNGVSLDLYEGTGLQFKKTNPAFAFDAMSAERTTNFKLPATPTNDRVFGCAKLPAFKGAGMRKKFDATLIDGVVVMDGFLYVASFDGKDYNSVFVTGELLELLRLKQAGKIADIISAQEVAQWTQPVAPSTGRSNIFTVVRYATGGGTPYPSVRLNLVIDRVLQALNVRHQPSPSVCDYVRYIPSKLSPVSSTDINFEGTPGQMADDGTYPVCYNSELQGLPSELFGTNDAKVQFWVGDPAVYKYRGVVRQLVALQALKITFPSDWDDDLFIGYFRNGDSPDVYEFAFYGNRSFDEFHRVSGSSLRGRTVDIDTGGKFTIISINDYVDRGSSSGRERGWAFSGISNSNMIAEGGEIEAGSAIRLQDNLPDVTVIDLLKTFAAISGLQLNYTNSDGVVFETMDIQDWETKDVSGRVIEISNVTRTLGDYAQNNIVEFARKDEVSEAERLTINYTIYNDNIEANKILQEVPFSEGAIYTKIGTTSSTILCKHGLEAIADANTNGEFMLRVALRENSGIQSLCNASTSVKAKVRLSLYEYNNIRAKTAIYINGIKYVWFDSVWSNNVAQFTLAKIA